MRDTSEFMELCRRVLLHPTSHESRCRNCVLDLTFFCRMKQGNDDDVSCENKQKKTVSLALPHYEGIHIKCRHAPEWRHTHPTDTSTGLGQNGSNLDRIGNYLWTRGGNSLIRKKEIGNLPSILLVSLACTSH